MAETKVIFWMINGIAYALLGISVFTLDRSMVYMLFGLSAIYWLVRIYYYIRMKNIEIRERELNLTKKEYEVEKEIEEDE